MVTLGLSMGATMALWSAALERDRRLHRPVRHRRVRRAAGQWRLRPARRVLLRAGAAARIHAGRDQRALIAAAPPLVRGTHRPADACRPRHLGQGAAGSVRQPGRVNGMAP
ncbi:MAG: hypothetical protein MZW92_00210 [Comamonadaceae bacterium]|nr:hypothetical protein [Comamonadaceae bacterium]